MDKSFRTMQITHKIIFFVIIKKLPILYVVETFLNFWFQIFNYSKTFFWLKQLHVNNKSYVSQPIITMYHLLNLWQIENFDVKDYHCDGFLICAKFYGKIPIKPNIS
jgi:hypothetical protein